MHAVGRKLHARSWESSHMEGRQECCGELCVRLRHPRHVANLQERFIVYCNKRTSRNMSCTFAAVKFVIF